MSARRSTAAALTLATLAAACGGGGSTDDALDVFAAASLTEAFSELGSTFEETTGIDLELSFAGSSDLATQIVEGAPADVYAAADLVTMDRVVDAGVASGRPVTFATNEMVLVVEAGNPLGVDGLDALADPDAVVVVCAPEVPCGRYAASIAAGAGIVPEIDSYEANVKAVVTKVALGEADVGLVYRTDAAAAGGDVSTVELPPDVNVTAEYPVVGVSDGAASAAFIEFLLGPTGREVLRQHGFGVP